MKLGIMQPYVFPYIGYFQLISAVDKFVIYDDVNFIKQGWINRNRILSNNGPIFFTIPLNSAGSFVLIRDIHLSRDGYHAWLTKFYKTLAQYYRKAPQYETVLPLIREILDNNPEYIAAVATRSIKLICSYLGINTEFTDTATVYKNSHLKAQERVIDICRQESATKYINSIGGIELYSRDCFQAEGIGLEFIKPGEITYCQYNQPFVPWLSIIDVLMFNTPKEIRLLLTNYDLV